MRYILVLAVLLLATPAKAAEDLTTAAAMTAACGHMTDVFANKTPKAPGLPHIHVAFCAAAFATLKDMIFIVAGDVRFWSLCLPPKVSVARLVGIFLTHMKTRPDRLREHWLVPALDGLKEEFPGPCKQG